MFTTWTLRGNMKTQLSFVCPTKLDSNLLKHENAQESIPEYIFFKHELPGPELMFW